VTAFSKARLVILIYVPERAARTQRETPDQMGFAPRLSNKSWYDGRMHLNLALGTRMRDAGAERIDVSKNIASASTRGPGVIRGAGARTSQAWMSSIRK